MSFSTGLKNALWAFKRSKRAKIITLVVLLFAVSTTAGYVLFAGGGARPGSENENTNLIVQTDEVVLVQRAIDGVMVPLARSNFFPVAVVVENLSASRPQSGLEKANLVYEALAEGGITRFLAVYASGEEVAKIGPVRSARTYFLDWVKELNAVFVHVGGSPDALSKLTPYNINDLNQSFHSKYFWRDQDRLKSYAYEHTLFTSSELLARALRDKQYPLVGEYTPWLFGDEPSRANRTTEEKTISIEFSTFHYKVDYRYNPETNSYDRSLAEQPHTMEDGAVISPKNVLVQYVPTKLADSEGRLSLETIGEGEAILFHNGRVVNVTWKKPSRQERTRFFDLNDKEVALTPGQTWIEVIPSDRDVSYQ